jgi:ribosomal protein S18 acetylase RimI-like enzyme
MNEPDQKDLLGKFERPMVARVERLALHAWPGLEVVDLNGWLLRHADGVTRRANSVWPNEVRDEMHDAAALEENLVRVEEFYSARKLPARFQICPVAQPMGLDSVLADRGYRVVARTAVQSANLQEMLAQLENAQGASSRLAGELTVEIRSQADSVWWQCFAAAEDVALSSVAGRKAICAQIEHPSAYAVAFRQGEAIAVGSATVEAEWVGFFNVATLAESRRLGAAKAVMHALGSWGKVNGATFAYLQVMDNNEAAKQLYARLGFGTGYSYYYREQSHAKID